MPTNSIQAKTRVIGMVAFQEINQQPKAQTINFGPDRRSPQSALRLIAING